ncbi:MAG: NAD(P) transhydrogenase subunit alpha [Kofleriaceae bacterium]|nr:NAD(P) transhydrogenase subunit alpha [Kofleriaceae bacterium]
MTGLLIMLLVFALSFTVGYVLISKVPPLLHTPLMSMTNALSAVTIIAALLVFAGDVEPPVQAVGGVALGAAAFNLVGGYAVTGRMLRMFRRGAEP